MISISRLNSILFVLAFMLFAFMSEILDWMGLSITGIEYYTWFGIAAVFVVVNFGFRYQRFHFSPVYLLLLGVVISFTMLNYWVVDVPIKRYIQGAFFTFLFAINFLLFNNVTLKFEGVLFIIRTLIVVATGVAIAAYLERIFVQGEYNPYLLRGVHTLLKDPSFLATLLNINITFCLVMYALFRKRRYLVIALFSAVTIALLLFVKAMIATLIIAIGFVSVFFYSRVRRYMIYLIVPCILLLLSVFMKSVVLEIEYKYDLYFGESRQATPRNALYIASFRIAKDHFPFGSGQGTFGSYPVGKTYSDIYYTYGLDRVHGLGPDDARGLTDSHFIFDTYWSGIIGEMGFIASFLYLLMWILPALGSMSLLKSTAIVKRALSFLVVFISLGIFIESIASPAPGQLAFILIYAGLGGMILRFLRDSELTS